MDQDQKELTLEESIKEVMQTLPPFIQAYLKEGKYTAVAKNLMTKFGLRIDQGGVLEREIMLLLMGIETPDEFTKSLVEEGKIDEKSISGIIQYLNEQIFIPLREEEKKNTPPTPPAMTPIKQSIPQPQQMPRPVQPQPQQRPQQIGLRQAILSAQKPSDEKLLEDREEPHIEFKKPMPPVLPVPPRVVPPPTPNLPGAPIPRTPVIQNIGGTQPIPPGVRFSPHPPIVPPMPMVQPKPIPPAPTIPTKPIPPTPPIRPVAPAPVSYSTDPYREPIDEKQA